MDNPFIDYLALMLVNMVAGFFLLAMYMLTGVDKADEATPPASRQAGWASGFAMVGFVATATGLHLALTWPLAGPFNIAFGEPTVLFGVIFLGLAWALAKGWDLTAVAIYAIFAGLVSIVVGARIINLGLTLNPRVSGLSFVLSGLAAIFLLPTLRVRDRWCHISYSVLLIVVAALWAFTGCMAYWGHIGGFGKWQPLVQRAMTAMPH